MTANPPSGPGPRKEIHPSGAEPPHVTESVDDAPVQKHTQAPNDVPTLGANAHGRDTQDPADQPMDDASMYDGRPGEDKDRKETEMP